jgi:hypothetical protein
MSHFLCAPCECTACISLPALISRSAAYGLFYRTQFCHHGKYDRLPDPSPHTYLHSLLDLDLLLPKLQVKKSQRRAPRAGNVNKGRCWEILLSRQIMTPTVVYCTIYGQCYYEKRKLRKTSCLAQITQASENQILKNLDVIIFKTILSLPVY